MVPRSLDVWLAEAKSRLEDAGVEDATLEAQVLAAHGFNQTRSWVLVHGSEPVHKDLEQLLRRRLAHEPLAYITGGREFFGREFIVGPGVLVPRQDTEALVEAALEQRAHRILDIGTGSGCIAVTLSLERPDWEVFACDVSREALSIAEENAQRLGATVSFVMSDLVASFGETEFDLIVSNPPYVRLDENLPRDVAQFEPASALFAGSDGLDIYRRLATEVPRVLSEGGLLVVEIGDGMGLEVREVFELAGWSFEFSRRDLAGRERVLSFARDPVKGS